jgi:hypothetical protein
VKTLALFYNREKEGITMDIAALSVAMSQAQAQTTASMSVMKLAMNTGVENANQMTDMMKNVSLDPNLGQHIDVSA